MRLWKNQYSGVWIRIRNLLSCKNSKKPLDSFYSVTLWLFIFEKLWKCTFKKYYAEKIVLKISLLLASWRSMTKIAGSGSESGSIGQKHGSEQCSGSGMLYRIPDPKTGTKERGEKKFVLTFFVATNFTKLQIILVLKCKIWANFQRIIELFTPKIVTKLSKIWIWDPEKTYSGCDRHQKFNRKKQRMSV